MKNWKEIAGKKLGFNLNGLGGWDSVEVHLRVFGHLPEDGCYTWYCLKILGWEKSNEKIEEFLNKLVSLK